MMICIKELCDLMIEVCSDSRMRSRTWQGVSKWSRGKYSYIGRLYSEIGMVPSDLGIFRSTGELREFTREKLWALWAIRGKHTSPQGAGAPPLGRRPNRTRRRPPPF